MSEERKRAVRDAAEAHTNLNIYAAVVTILEGGHLYGAADGGSGLPAQFKIIRICQVEQAKWLRKYDAAIARSLKP